MRLQEVANTRWKITNTLLRLLLSPINYINFSLNRVHIGSGASIFGIPLIQKHSEATINIGKNFRMRNGPRYNPIAQATKCVLSARESGAKIIIGENVRISSSAIVSAEMIKIGDRVMIGANTAIIDTDFHPLNAEQRTSDPRDGISEPVFIGDDVFIGMNSIILKGTSIGKGCVVGAGSVVSGSVPAGTIVVGNPAKIVKFIS